MRDTDIDFKSVFITKAKSGIKSVQDLKGKKFGLGSADSAQAAILPLKYLQNELGESIKDVEIVKFNSDLGKHGDTGRSEFDVLEAIKMINLMQVRLVLVLGLEYLKKDYFQQVK